MHVLYCTRSPFPLYLCVTVLLPRSCVHYNSSCEFSPLSLYVSYMRDWANLLPPNRKSHSVSIRAAYKREDEMRKSLSPQQFIRKVGD
jgi:hypothetical protein